jgi:hypothetical protein
LWDEPTAIHLGEDAGEAEFLPQPAETIGDHLRHADNGLAAQHLVIANGLEPLTALDPPCGVGAEVAPIDAVRCQRVAGVRVAFPYFTYDAGPEVRGEYG